MQKIAVIDNYDSFTFNLVQYIEKCRAEVFVFRNDEIPVDALSNYDKICISPGPGLPAESGITLDVVRKFSATKNILGICLGLQAITEVFGGRIKNLDTVLHGLSRETFVMKEDFLFSGMPGKFNAGRYHSWVADKNFMPRELEIIAVDQDEEVMSIRHRQFNIRAVQFHPESILTEHGEKIIFNWVNS